MEDKEIGLGTALAIFKVSLIPGGWLVFDTGSHSTGLELMEVRLPLPLPLEGWD